MKTIVDLGTEFQALRRHENWGQERLATATGMRQEAVSRFERGRGNDFSLAKLLRMAHTLGYELQFVRANARPTLDDVRAEAQVSGNMGPESR